MMTEREKSSSSSTSPMGLSPVKISTEKSSSSSTSSMKISTEKSLRSPFKSTKILPDNLDVEIDEGGYTFIRTIDLESENADSFVAVGGKTDSTLIIGKSSGGMVIPLTSYDQKKLDDAKMIYDSKWLDSRRGIIRGPMTIFGRLRTITPGELFVRDNVFFHMSKWRSLWEEQRYNYILVADGILHATEVDWIVKKGVVSIAHVFGREPTSRKRK